MYFLYSLLLVTWGILLLPVYLYRALRYQKYLPGISQRFGRLADALRFNNRPTIWFHSCSVGETLSVQPLAHALHERFPEARFVFSTITRTGQQIAKQRFSKYGEGNTFYFPIDLAAVARRVLDWIRPVMMIIIDTEIWPNVLDQVHRRGVPIVLVNGRISAASFRYYRMARPILRRVFRNYKILMMKSNEDAARIEAMGASPDKIVVVGNIKFDRDLVENEASETTARTIDVVLGLESANGPLIVAGSTHPGEEEILIEALRRIRERTGLERTRLLLAPRHPERFDHVADLAVRAGFCVARRSVGGPAIRDAEVLILDSLGELATAYRFATVAFVGGTLIRHGGQSIMEPALHAKPIVIGPSMENFPQIIDEFRACRGVVQITAGQDDKALQIRQLVESFTRLLGDPQAREGLGKAAYSILEQNRGAAQRTFEQIVSIYEEVRTR